MKTWPLYIPGAKPSGTLREVQAPYDGNVIAQVETADSSGVDRALSTADNLYRDRKAWLPASQRLDILRKTADIMASRRDELALEAAREGGKPLLDSLVEVDRAIDGVMECMETLRTEGGREIPMGLNAASANKLAVTRKVPIGVVVSVSAFNHPLNLIVHQVAPAVAVGCPVIVKPADDTPLSCFRFLEILHKAGLPPEWCQALLTSDLDVATELVTDSRVAFFSFIGSAKVGWMLRSKLAPGTRCALEHGGAAPVIVERDADLEITVPALTKAAFYHAGQVCVSVQRVFAHKSIARELAEKLAEAGKKMVIGDPTQKETEVGPLIRPGELKRVSTWVDEAVSEGAEILSGGKPVGDTCYECTVLYNPSGDSKVSQLEIFGPVVCVYPVENSEEAFQRANSLPYSFQAAVYTQNIDKAMEAYTNLNASAVMVNEHTAFRVDWMPFAGLKQSGLGTGGIPYTMEDMQVDKMLVIKSPGL